MQHATPGRPARFRPTWRQSLGRGLYLGGLVSACAVAAIVPVSVLLRDGPGSVPPWIWGLSAVGPVVVGVLGGASLGRRSGADIDARGIRTVAVFTRGCQPWSRVVDLRAERRGSRTVVSVYLESGGTVRLRAPYDGELFAADPRFDLKVHALAQLWRSHHVGGVPG